MFMTLLTSWAFLIWMIALFVVVVRRRFVCGAIVNDVVHWIAQVVSCPAGRTVLCSVCDGFWRRSAHVWVRGAWFVNTFHSVYLFVCVYICTSVSLSFYIFCSFYLYVCPVLCPSGVLICSYIFYLISKILWQNYLFFICGCTHDCCFHRFFVCFHLQM